MKKRKIYSGEFKSKIVLDLLSGKKKLPELAKEHKLHPNQIKNWKSIFLSKAGEMMEDKRRKKENTLNLKRNL